jgi:hypothetical protein
MKKKLYAFFSLLSLVLSILIFMFWLIGSHGSLRFRPHNGDDWGILIGILISLFFFIYFLVSAIKNKSN